MVAQEIEDVAKIRRRLGLTQQQLAQVAGVSQSMIAKLESGAIDPSYSSVRKIFSALENFSKKTEAKVSDFMSRKIIFCSPSESVHAVAKKMRSHAISQMPVLRGKKVVGIVGESEILDALLDDRQNPSDSASPQKSKISAGNKNKISEIMKEPPPIVSPEAGAEVVSNLLKFYPIVLAAKNGKIVGVVAKSDLLARA